VAVWSVTGGTYTLIGTSTNPIVGNEACARIICGANMHGQTSPTAPNIDTTNYIFRWGTVGSTPAYNTLMV
jgi:hypothetical protein